MSYDVPDLVLYTTLSIVTPCWETSSSAGLHTIIFQTLYGNTTASIAKTTLDWLDWGLWAPCLMSNIYFPSGKMSTFNDDTGDLFSRYHIYIHTSFRIFFQYKKENVENFINRTPIHISRAREAEMFASDFHFDIKFSLRQVFITNRLTILMS